MRSVRGGERVTQKSPARDPGRASHNFLRLHFYRLILLQCLRIASCRLFSCRLFSCQAHAPSEGTKTHHECAARAQPAGLDRMGPRVSGCMLDQQVQHTPPAPSPPVGIPQGEGEHAARAAPLCVNNTGTRCTDEDSFVNFPVVYNESSFAPAAVFSPMSARLGSDVMHRR
jgi:hypothetical protein